jgi:hypothetical protein
LSCDRQAQLIGETFNALDEGVLPSTTNRPLSTYSPTSKISPWKAKVQYKVVSDATKGGIVEINPPLEASNTWR